MLKAEYLDWMMEAASSLTYRSPFGSLAPFQYVGLSKIVIAIKHQQFMSECGMQHKVESLPVTIRFRFPRFLDVSHTISSYLST